MNLESKARRFGLEVPDLDRAATALAGAVREYLAETKTGKGRKTAAGFTQVVRQALSRQRCSKELFELVLERAIEEGHLVQERSESGRLYLAPAEPEPEGFPAEESISTALDSNGAVRANPAVPLAGDGPPPQEDYYPLDHRCPHCGWEVPLCAHCALPAFDDCLYVDSKGRWRCDGCNDLHLSQSWGGFLRWKKEGDALADALDAALEPKEGEE